MSSRVFSGCFHRTNAQEDEEEKRSKLMKRYELVFGPLSRESGELRLLLGGVEHCVFFWGGGLRAAAS